MDRKTLALGDMQVSCNNCNKTFTPDSTSGSSHLKTYMLQNVSNCCDCNDCSDSGTNMPTAVSLEKLAQLLCEYIVKEDLPFSTFDFTGFEPFKSRICAVYPNFETVINKKALFRDALAYSKDERMIVESELLNAPGRICFGIDKWETKCTEEEYVCLTASWIDHNWRFQKRIIRLFGFIWWNNIESFANEILSSLDQWKVADRVFTFILEDPSYSDSLITSLKSRLQGENSLVLSGEFCHMRSYSSIISHLGQASIKLMDDVLPKIRNTLLSLKQSIPNRKKFYENARTRFGLDTTKKKLCTDVFITWDSTFLMLDSFLYYRDALVEFVSNDKVGKLHYCLAQDEWALVNEVHKFLKPIYEVTKDISSSKISNSTLYFYVVWLIHTELLKISDGPPSVLSGMVKEMQAEYEKYWSSFNHLLARAAVLNPQCKMLGVQDCYAKLYGEVRGEEMIVAVKMTLFELYEEYKQINAVTSPRVGTSKVSNFDNNGRSKQYMSFFEGVMERAKALNAEKAKNWSELEGYLDEGPVDVDVFEYWDRYSGYGGPYRVLGTMARDVLAMAVSVAPLDSGFRLGRKFVAPCRSALSPGNIEALACYGDWLRAKDISSDKPKDSGYVLGEEEYED